MEDFVSSFLHILWDFAIRNEAIEKCSVQQKTRRNLEIPAKETSCIHLSCFVPFLSLNSLPSIWMRTNRRLGFIFPSCFGFLLSLNIFVLFSAIPILFKAYSWFCVQGPLLGVQGIIWGAGLHGACKASSVHMYYHFLWPVSLNI